MQGRLKLKSRSEKAFLVAVSLISVISLPAAAQAQKAAVSRPYKVGYFNLTMVKLACPEAAGSEALRLQAEAQLKRDAEEGNRKIEKAQSEKKSAEELQKMVAQIQTEINAKQQALAQLLQTSSALANEKIARAVNAVARENDLDLVVDGAGVFTGGQQVLDNGLDITSETIKKLQPGLQSTTRSAEAPTKPAAQPVKKTQ
ncbi:OmpH family outer membrane protein [bacterium]|jgi:Skp family chaperone for outer membrane proteins|nr:OmpH family outer membrane protein [bacterium]